MASFMDLTAKNILVVGAASDIGQSIVIQIDNLGGKIAMLDQDEEALQTLSSSLIGTQYYKKISLNHDDEIEPIINEVIYQNGLFHGLVFSAAIGGLRPLSLTKHNNMQSMMDVNCFSFVEIVRCLMKKKAIEKGGSIVAISSISSIKGMKSKLAYSASKAALDASVRCLAAELGDMGIRVNSVLKAGVSTDNKLDYIKNVNIINNNETKRRQILGEIEPKEIARLASFLLSDAVKTLTGASIILDSGYTL